VRDEPPPRSSTVSNNIKTIAPATHTHGELYQSLELTLTDFVVVVVEEPELEPIEAGADPWPSSWANIIVCKNAIIKKVNKVFKVRPLVSCFIIKFVLLEIN